MNIKLSSIFDPLSEYLLKYITNIGGMLKLRLVCKQFDAYVKSILHHYALVISDNKQLYISQEMLNCFKECVLSYINVNKYRDFKNMVGEKFIKSNIKSYTFNNISKMPMSCLKHFSNAESYTISTCTFTNKHFKHLMNAKHYNIKYCHKINHEVGQYIGGAESYNISYNNILKVNLLFKYISGAKEYTFTLFRQAIDDSMKYISGAEKYCIFYMTTESSDNMQYIRGAKEYEFYYCDFEPGDLVYITGAQKYKFKCCEIGIENMQYLSGAKEYEFVNQSDIDSECIEHIKDGDHYIFHNMGRYRMFDYRKLGKIGSLHIVDSILYNNTLMLPDVEKISIEICGKYSDSRCSDINRHPRTIFHNIDNRVHKLEILNNDIFTKFIETSTM